jgi:hypothetical protein
MNQRKIQEPVMRRVLEKQGHICLYCLLPFGTVTSRGTHTLVGDPWIAYTTGQTSGEESNTVAACQICNAFKADHAFDSVEAARRYILARRVSRHVVVYWIPSVSVTEHPQAWAREYALYLSETLQDRP